MTIMNDFCAVMVLVVSLSLVYVVLHGYIWQRNQAREQQSRAREKALGRQEREVRVATVTRLRAKGADAVKELLDLAQGKDYSVRRAALATLGDIGEVTVPYLLEAVRSKDQGLRLAAVNAAARVRHASLVPDLLAVLHGPDRGLSSAAAAALGQMGDPSVIPDLLDALNPSSNQDLRWASAWSLGQLKAGRAVPGIFSMLRDASSGEDEFLMDVLAEIGDDTVSEMVVRLADPDDHVQTCAANVLRHISTKEALDALAAWHNRHNSE